MPKFKDITGNKYGCWTVLGFSHKAKTYCDAFWKCQCDCGVEAVIQGGSLKKGASKSCGCDAVKQRTKHGMEGTPTYNCWAHMLARCRNPKTQGYARWGGRGIKVCERWLKFENFYADMGLKPDDKSLDRIDNDGDYTPENCRWADVRQQLGNQAKSLRFEWEGKIRTFSDLCHEHGMPRRKVYQRLLAGWNLQDALTIKKASRWDKVRGERRCATEASEPRIFTTEQKRD